METGIRKIMELSEELKLDPRIKYTSVIIYRYIEGRIESKNLIQTILYLSTKLLGVFTKPVVFYDIKDEGFSYEIEKTILDILSFRMDIFDIYGFVKKYCELFGFNFEKKLKRLDDLFLCGNINDVSFIEKKKYDVEDFVFVLFSEKELLVIENFFQVDLNRENIKRIGTSILKSSE